jgi:hypothetical protein
MPDFPPDIQSLVSRMLTVDPRQRIRIDEIKALPAFRIGIFIPTYVCPSPLPLPHLRDPVDVDAAHPDALNVLRQIGFTDDELLSSFSQSGTSWAKVFHHMLTTSLSLDNLPWADDGDAVDDAEDASFIVSPVAPGKFNSQNPDDPFSRCRHVTCPPSAACYSLVEKAQWAEFAAHGFKNDLMQPCVEIALPLDVLMAKMQRVLTGLNMQWFHPDDLTIIARLPEQPVYLQVRVEFEATESLKMDLYFTQATPTMVQLITDNIRAVLTSE